MPTLDRCLAMKYRHPSPHKKKNLSEEQAHLIPCVLCTVHTHTHTLILTHRSNDLITVVYLPRRHTAHNQNLGAVVLMCLALTLTSFSCNSYSVTAFTFMTSLSISLSPNLPVSCPLPQVYSIKSCCTPPSFSFSFNVQ